MPFFAPSPGGNKIILENCVTNRLPIRYGFSYTSTSTNNTIIVRTGARLDQGSGSGSDVFMAGYHSGKGPNGYCNKILVESGASIRCWSFYANSVNGFVGISNATVTCVSGWYYNEHLGFSLGGALDAYGKLRSNGYGHGTNMVLALSGTTPKLKLTNSRLGVDPSSKIRFDLPSEGYPETAQPLIDVPGTMFFFDPGCVIEFTGAAEMLAYHKDVLKRSRRYKLVQATSITNIDDVMASAQARLPERLTLEKKTEGKYTQLWLRVRPQLGMTLIYR